MKTKSYKCKLKTDVIINVKSATVGCNKTLDFIPGSNFLGIVASYYSEFGNDALTVFHSGKIRFSDAHPANENGRSLKMPYTWQTPKTGTKLYIHNEIPDLKAVAKLQLKPKSSGFFCFNKEKKTAIELTAPKAYALKSAYNRHVRLSQDDAMFGYESIAEGTEMVFSIYAENEVQETILSKIDEKIIGSNKHIGRSKTAQYGLVDIKPEDDWHIVDDLTTGNQNRLVIYAENRLIFFDEDKNCRTIVSPSDFKLTAGEIDFEHSYIRTFQYAPWNSKHQSFDCDRFGIEKGSVIVINNPQGNVGCFVGEYQNEGFGKILCNPDFLNADKYKKNGESDYRIVEKKVQRKTSVNYQQVIDEIRLLRTKNQLFNYLAEQKEDKLQLDIIRNLVGKFITQNFNLFKTEKFASQFGTIRSYAMSTDTDENAKNKIIEYISHGKKSKDWEGERKKQLTNFMNETIGKNSILSQIQKKDTLRLAMINLASEMAKKCNKNG